MSHGKKVKKYVTEGSDISATATCGQDDFGSPRSDLYCKLVGGHNTGFNVQNIQGQFCDHCNSNEPNKAHPVTNAIDGTERWWQSPPLSRGPKYNQVNITLDLGQRLGLCNADLSNPVWLILNPLGRACDLQKVWALFRVD
ncbi:unnamed protein product [Arctogadus glacialis]